MGLSEERIGAWYNYKLKRRFTVRSMQETSSILMLTNENMQRMKIQFPDYYEELFNQQTEQLHKIIVLKLTAMECCNRIFSKFVRSGSVGEPNYGLRVLTNG